MRMILVEFIYCVFTHSPGNRYRRWFRFLLLCPLLHGWRLLSTINPKLIRFQNVFEETNNDDIRRNFGWCLLWFSCPYNIRIRFFFCVSGQRSTDHVSSPELADKCIWVTDSWWKCYEEFFSLSLNDVCSLYSFRWPAAWSLHTVVLPGFGFGADRLPRRSAVFGARDPEGPPPSCLTSTVLPTGGDNLQAPHLFVINTELGWGGSLGMCLNHFCWCISQRVSTCWVLNLFPVIFPLHVVVMTENGLFLDLGVVSAWFNCAIFWGPQTKARNMSKLCDSGHAQKRSLGSWGGGGSKIMYNYKEGYWRTNSTEKC